MKVNEYCVNIVVEIGNGLFIFVLSGYMDVVDVGN